MSDSVQTGELDVRAWLNVVWIRRWWLIASITLFTATFAGVSFVLPPVYRATAVLIPVDSDRNGISGGVNSTLGQLGALAPLVGIDVRGNNSIEEALAVLKSREFTERFIADWELMPVLFANDWDAKQGQWAGGTDDQPTPAQAYKLFDRKIRSIERDSATGLVMLHIDWKDRMEAAKWANELVRRLNEEMRERAIIDADASIGFLEDELQTTAIVGTRDAINRIVESQLSKRMLANVTHEYALRVVDKAMPPDKNDPIRPKKILLATGGFLLGFAVGLGLIFGRYAWDVL